jgi:Tfp pilus assembly protein PilF
VEAAKATYQRAIQQNPRDLTTYLLLAAIEEKTGNWQKAQEIYEKALRVQPDHSDAANNLAYLLLQHGGNTDVALSYAQVARRGMPESPNTADTLGWAYFRKGSYGLATDMFEEALKRSPNNPTYHYHLGLAFQKNNDPARAREHFERVLKINPRYAQADEIRKALAQLGAG